MSIVFKGLEKNIDISSFFYEGNFKKAKILACVETYKKDTIEIMDNEQLFDNRNRYFLISSRNKLYCLKESVEYHMLYTNPFDDDELSIKLNITCDEYNDKITKEIFADNPYIEYFYFVPENELFLQYISEKDNIINLSSVQFNTNENFIKNNRTATMCPYTLVNKEKKDIQNIVSNFIKIRNEQER